MARVRDKAGADRGRRKRRNVRLPKEDEEGPDAIVCRLCGKTFRAITFSHLRFAHGQEGERPVRDYKRRFGLPAAASRDTRRLMRRRREEHWDRLGKHWTRARVIREIRRLVAAGACLNQRAVPLTLYVAGQRLFGSWARALRAAGQDPERHRKYPRLDAGGVIAAIRALLADGRKLSDRTADREHPHLHDVAERIFGSWGAALRAAGANPRDHRERRLWSIASARAWVLTRHEASRSVASGEASLALRRFVQEETGLSWSRFVVSLGVPYPRALKRLDWSRKMVIAEIRRLAKGKEPMNRKAVERRVGQALIHQARKYFGSWDAALRAAGIDPLTVRRRRDWTKRDVLDAIRARHRAGRSLLRKDVFREEPRLVKAAARLFPSSWNRAVAAAGLVPGGAPRRPR
jgi:hypothetical protein